MILAFGLGTFDQRHVVDVLGVSQYWPSHFNCIVQRQLAHHFWGRVGDRNQSSAERRARGNLDLVKQPTHHVVEQRDLLARVFCRP